MGKDDFRHDLSGFMEKIKEVVEDPIPYVKYDPLSEDNLEEDNFEKE